MNLFDISKLQYDAIIVLDGKLPPRDIIMQFNAKKILSADGAAIQLMELGIESTKIIGDLDTLKAKGYYDKVENDKLIYLPDQDSNDFEKVLNYSQQHNYKNLLVLGIHGGELEHTLNNWSVFIRFSKKMNLYIYDENRFGFALFDKIKLQVKKGEIISLIPQQKAILTTIGLQWELNNYKLELGINEGARNKAIKEIIEINIYSGSVLLFLDYY